MSLTRKPESTYTVRLIPLQPVFREFITGFRKRKLEKQRTKKEKYEAHLKKEKAEKRKEVFI